jgi:hypothetical protein
MVHYKLECLNNTVRIEIINSNPDGCSLAFIGGVGLFMFVNPILTIFFLSIKIALGTVLVCAVAWLISGYFIRLYLWNKYGTEVFIIKDNILETYNDYKFFKDTYKVYHFTKIEILYFVEEVDNINELRKEKILKNSKQSSVIGFQIDDEVITSHNEIPISDIIKITESIKNMN